MYDMITQANISGFSSRFPVQTALRLAMRYVWPTYSILLEAQAGP